MFKILSKKILNETVEEMVIEAPFVARRCEPGQFVILRVDADGERVPLTIVDYDREKQTVTIIYQVVGYSTQLLAQKEAGDFIEDFVGPLGKPAPLHPAKRVLCIGGGVGVAPLYPQMKKVKELGAKVDVIIGARNKDYVILEEECRAVAENFYVATDDGSLGTKGRVTDVLNQLIEEGNQYDEVIAIGPLIMMKAVCDITKVHNIPTAVSLNPVMIDGTGMCGGCRVTVGGKIQFACVDGPDFDGHQVDFEECMRRQQMFKKEEEHACRVGLGEK